MSEFDTTALLTDIRERGSLPANDVRFTNTSILSAATKELREGCAPLLSQARTEHLVYPYAQPVVSGTAAYRMPPRAVGGSLRDVAFIDTAGHPIRLRQLSADEVEEIGGADNTGTPYAYWLQGYKVALVPTPNVSGTLSTPYYARPNLLVLPAAAAVCAGATYFPAPSNSVEVIANTPPETLETSQRIDVVRASPGFETLAENVDAEVEEISTGVFAYRFGATTDPGIALGDYICLPGQSPVPQLPVEMHGLLAARTTRRLLKAVGDDRWQALEADVQELEDRAKDWLAPRVAGDTQQAGGSIGSSGLVSGMGFFGWGGTW